MKESNFPDRIYIPRDIEYPQFPDIWWEEESSEDNVEYIHKDTFVSDIIKWLNENITSYVKVGNINETYEGFNIEQCVEDFKGFVKENKL